jgi:hypothetical protein
MPLAKAWDWETMDAVRNVIIAVRDEIVLSRALMAQGLSPHMVMKKKGSKKQRVGETPSEVIRIVGYYLSESSDDNATGDFPPKSRRHIAVWSLPLMGSGPSERPLCVLEAYH